MNRQQICDKLAANHHRFTTYFLGLSEEDSVFSLRNEKWSAVQHADHILRSLSPVRRLFGLPWWIRRWVFKKANRPSKSYEKLVERYHQRLAQGGKASGRFVPSGAATASRKELAAKIEKEVSKLGKAVMKYSEAELDRLVLPHPLLGKVTLREMLYFTIYHVEHHNGLAARDLASK